MTENQLKNVELVAQVFQILKEIGVAEIIVCAGARNAPFVVALESTDFIYRSYFEERSAGFYALGRIQFSQRPVAVLTTSGTAVAELLPAVIEAHYQTLPLIVISADRPKSYRGSGAPQSIEHVSIFSQYVQSCQDWDIQTQDFDFQFNLQRPLHLNVCFDEPLLDGNLRDVKLPSLKSVEGRSEFPSRPAIFSEPISSDLPFAILGQISEKDRSFVGEFLLKNHIPHYAEFLSGLRNHPDLLSLQIRSSDQFVKKIFQNKICKSILRIGGIPTLRLWRDLEFELKNVPVQNFSDKPFKGLSRPCEIYPMEALKNLSILRETNAHIDLQKNPELEIQDFFIEDSKLFNIKNKLCSEYPLSEPSLVQYLADKTIKNAVYVGNSLPIRLWDGFHTTFQADLKCYANRGANGIDGQISTYLGWSKDFVQSWCIVGDLTALYDLAALGLACETNGLCKVEQSQDKSVFNKKRIIVINNNGGQIFNRLFGEKKFLNAQNISFKSWAELWGWDYLQVKNQDSLKTLSQDLPSTRLIIEIIPDPEQTKSFWHKWDQLWR